MRYVEIKEEGKFGGGNLIAKSESSSLEYLVRRN